MSSKLLITTTLFISHHLEWHIKGLLIYQQDHIISQCHSVTDHCCKNNDKILRCDSAMVKVCLGLRTNMTWLDIGKDYGLG